jgi:murein DD-endopeptidase MepM/ murein hydrolase activator NlpD
MRLLTVLAALLAALAIPAVAAADTTAEGETFTWTPSTAAQVQTDAAASGGSTLDLAGASTASKTVTTAAASDSFVLHVRNTLCSGREQPRRHRRRDRRRHHDRVELDVPRHHVRRHMGRRLAHRPDRPPERPVDLNTCDRNYFLDKVTFHATPVAAPADGTVVFDGNFQSGSLAAYPTSCIRSARRSSNDPAGVQVNAASRARS